MTSADMPMPGGDRRSAGIILVCLVVAGALRLLEVHWGCVLALVLGALVLPVQAFRAQQHAVKAAPRAVSVDVEQPAPARKLAHRHRGTLDTIADESPTDEATRGHRKKSPNHLTISNFDQATRSGGKMRRRHSDNSSNRILGDLESPSFSRIPTPIDRIDEYQEKAPKPKEEKTTPSPAPSARSTGSVRSETSQRIIDDLKAQIQRLKEDKTTTPRSERSDRTHGSARSDSSQKVIGSLQEELQALKDALKSARQSTSPRQGAGDLKALLRSLQLPEECDKMLADEGVDFVEDLADYTEAELIGLGFKRGHAKRVLKAAASSNGSMEEEAKRTASSTSLGG